MTPDEIKALKVGQRVQVWARVAGRDLNDMGGMPINAEINGEAVWITAKDIISAEPLPIEVGDTVEIGAAGFVAQVKAIDGSFAWVLCGQMHTTESLANLTLIKKASDQ